MLCSRAAIIDEGRIVALDTITNLIGLLGGGVIQVGVERADPAILKALAVLPMVKEALRMDPPVAPPSIDDAAGEPGERTPVPSGAVIKIVSERSQEAVVAVIGYLNAHDISLTSLEILEPNLESVFLHLTGKKLRD